MIEAIPDFETVSAADLKEVGAWRYAEDPTTAILCLAVKYRKREQGQPLGCWLKFLWYPGDQQYRPAIEALLARDDVMWIAHNTGFEKAIWKNIMVPVHGFPVIPPDRWHDTQAVCAMKAIPVALEKVLHVLRLPVEKDMEGNRLTLSLSRFARKGNSPILTPAVLERVGQYCLVDVDGQALLHERLGYLPKAEREVWLADQKINERGVRLDLPLVSAMRQIVDDAMKPLAAEFTEMTGLAFTQAVKLKEWCHANGAPIENLQKDYLEKTLGIFSLDGDDDDSLADDESLSRQHHLDLPDHVRRVLQIRNIAGSASIKKLVKMEACVCADGRARGLLRYHGAGPGRWAAVLLQPQNFPRPTLELDDKPVNHNDLVAALSTGDAGYVRSTMGEPIEACISGLRHTLIPGTGRRFCSGDYSGIQARSILAISGQYDKAELMAAGADVYIDMAEKIYGRPITKKDNPEERTIGKNTVLGSGFGMGGRMFQKKYAAHHPLEFCNEVVRVYRQEWAPKVPLYWKGLERAAIKCVYEREPTEFMGVEFRLVNMWLTVRLPSGRLMWYFNPQRDDRAAPWDDDVILPGVKYQAQKQGHWTWCHSFGGQLAENVVCGIEADLLRCSILKLEDNGFPVVLLVHDEIVAEPEICNADQVAFQQIMCDVPEWCRALKIPVAVEGWTDDRYRK